MAEMKPPAPPPDPRHKAGFAFKRGKPGRPSNEERAAAEAALRGNASKPESKAAPAGNAGGGAGKPAGASEDDVKVDGKDVADDLDLLFNDYAANGLGEHWKVKPDLLARLGKRGAAVINRLSPIYRTAVLWFTGVMFVLHVLALVAVRLVVHFQVRRKEREAERKAAAKRAGVQAPTDDVTPAGNVTPIRSEGRRE